MTYDSTTYTWELDGSITTERYEVLGRDKCSVVIRDIDPNPLGMDEFFELSEFAVIQFDGPDSYWIESQLGRYREYFKRIQ